MNKSLPKPHGLLRPKLVCNLLFLIIMSGLTSPVSFADETTRIELPSLAVTGNPLGLDADQLIVPVTILNGRELSLKRESTLGETLNGIPGISSTNFGPNASRPVIRGLDAERVRIMQNGVGVVDASSLSFDHAVSVDPLVIEQIDVIRGPAALLYGGSAVGGVVNAVDHRIPTEKLEGVTGRTEARLGGAANESNMAGVVDIGNGQIAIHAYAYVRKSNDLNIPGFAVSNRKALADGTLQTNSGTLKNSSATSNGGALGASLTLDNGYLGASYSGFNSNYGTVAEENVRIDMKSQRWDIAYEFNELSSVINRVKFRLAHTDYQHQEIDTGVAGTTFKSSGIEGSLEAGHAKIGNISGVVGLQFQNTSFEALGAEAFVPSTNTQSKALYLYEELPVDQFKFSLGGRTESNTVDAGAWSKNSSIQNASFNPTSYALGGLYTFTPYWSLASNLSHNERAPSYFELYANGAHLATGQYEVGNPNFSLERSNGIDAQIRWKDGKNSFSAGPYYTKFSSFIGLLNTGSIVTVQGQPLQK